MNQQFANEPNRFTEVIRGKGYFTETVFKENHASVHLANRRTSVAEVHLRDLFNKPCISPVRVTKTNRRVAKRRYCSYGSRSSQSGTGSAAQARNMIGFRDCGRCNSAFPHPTAVCFRHIYPYSLYTPSITDTITFVGNGHEHIGLTTAVTLKIPLIDNGVDSSNRTDQMRYQ